jgi:hypothetical protein
MHPFVAPAADEGGKPIPPDEAYPRDPRVYLSIARRSNILGGGVAFYESNVS